MNHGVADAPRRRGRRRGSGGRSLLVLAAVLGVAGSVGLVGRRTARQVRALRDAGARVPALDHAVTVPGEGATMHLVVLGDSAAAGHGLPHADDGLGRQVAHRLAGATGRPVQVASHAVDGATTSAVVAEQVPEVPSDAEVVLVGVGVNDAVRGRRPAVVAAGTERLLLAVAERAPSATVVLLTCPDLSNAPGMPPVLRPALGVACRRVAAAQRRVAGHLGVTIVGAGGYLPPEAFGTDGFHPGPIGVGVLADRVAAALAGG